jgi:hypothetical protein
MAESHREEIAKLEALYAGNPGGRVFVHLAEAYRKAGEHERARRILDEGLARHTDSASGYVVLGRVLADMQITAEAEIAFRRVLELDGGNLIALRWLGDLARQAGRNAEAALHYRELLIRNPSNEEVRDLVEIVEREAADGPAGGAAVGSGDTEDAFAGLTLDTDESHEPSAVSPPVAPAEEPAVTPPPAAAGAAEPDVTPWSAAPGETGDAEEAPVEYGLVQLDTESTEQSDETAEPSTGATGFAVDAPEAEPAGYDAPGAVDAAPDMAPDAAQTDSRPREWNASYDRPEERAGSFEPGEDESDVVSSVDQDDSDVLELDELRRDDEAEPVEIHLLDPSYEATGEEGDEEYVRELDLSDMATGGLLEDADDYADDSFVADLSAAAEEPAEDELLSGADVMDAALTLLPDDGEIAAEEPRSAADDAAADDLAAHAAADADVGGAVFGGSVAEFRGAGQQGDPAGTELEAAPPDDDEAAAPDAAQADDAEIELLETEIDSEPVEASDSYGKTATGEVEESEEPFAESDADRGFASRDWAAGDLRTANLADLSGAAEPAAESTPAEEPAETAPVAEVRRGAEIGLVTETMAVLYRSQGFHDRAADVYRALLRDRPNDDRLAAKLREAEEAAGVAGRTPPAETPSDDDAGEVWLRGVGAAWTAPADVAADEATPYAWTGEAEDGEGGEPISSYLQDLVSWKAGSGAWIQPDAGGVEGAAGEIEMPDWLDGPGKAEPWTAESGAEGYPAVPAAEAGWSAPADGWEADAGSTAEPAAAGQAEDAAPEEWQVPAEPVDLPQDTGADAGADVGEGGDAGGGWTPLDLEDDPVAAPTASADAAPAGLQSEAASDEDSSDDDDLEMFRSWLQSLKK